jgi:hypothetical protein
MLEARLFLTLLAVDRDPSGLSSSITCRARIATCTTTLSMSSAEDYCDEKFSPSLCYCQQRGLSIVFLH